MKQILEVTDYRFHIFDYVVFAAMIILSTLVGVCFGIIKKTPTEEEREPSVATETAYGAKLDEYLLGSRQMEVFPVAMSLIGSFISGVTILGTPPLIYNTGTTYFLIVISIILSSIIIMIVYLPIFHVLRVASSYEYLSLRFHPIIRMFASVVFIMDEIFFLPFVIYVPALALSQASGINTILLSFIITTATVIYTLLGGMKAVVYTDTWQVYLMFFSVVMTVVIGTFQMGFSEAIKRANEGGRIFINWSLSLYVDQTAFSVLIGGTWYWLSFNAVNQTMVQRYMSVATLKKARQALGFFTIGMSLFVVVVLFSGILIYASFMNCDPMSAGLVTKADQMIVLYVMYVIGFFKGLPGLFVAGVFGAALSSLSVILNATGLVVLEDVVRGALKKQPSERVSTIIVKATVVILGSVAFLFVIVLNMLEGVFAIASALTGLSAGITFGLFTLGMLVPWANTHGAVVGGLAGFGIGSWITFGHQAMIAAGKIVREKLPTNVSACSFNVTLHETVPPDMSNVFSIYRITYFWTTPITCSIIIAVGSVVSLFWKYKKIEDINADYITPILHRFLPSKCFENSITKRDDKQN